MTSLSEKRIMSVQPSILSCVLCALAIPGTAHASVEQVSVRVDGLACPFCVHGIDTRLTGLAGVGRTAGVKTSLETGTARFTWNADVQFDPADVRRAIREAGFTPRDISVWVTGTAGRDPADDSATTLLLADGNLGSTVILRPGDQADRQQSWRDLVRLSAGDEGTRRVRVAGVVRARDGDRSWEIVLGRWAPLEFGALVTVRADEFAGVQGSTRAMKALAELDGVIHAEAVDARDRVEIWMTRRNPDVAALSELLGSVGYTVSDIRVQQGSDDDHRQ